MASGKKSGKKKKGGMFDRFWNLDVEKTLGQGLVTWSFYALILRLMNWIALLPLTYADEINKEMIAIIDTINRYPPSMFIGLVLMVVVALGRDIPVWKKAAPVAVGILFAAFVDPDSSLAPLVYLLMQPPKPKGEQAIGVPEGQVPLPSLSASPEEAPVHIERHHEDDEGEDAEEIVTEQEPEESLDDDLDIPETEEKKEEGTAPLLVSDGEVPEDFVDPIEEFLTNQKKD